MSIMKNLETYEKMLQNPANLVSTTGKIKQPMPTAAELSGVTGGKKIDTSNLPEESKRQGNLEDVSPEEEAFLSTIDKRMAARKRGELPAINEQGGSDRIVKLENQVKEIQELLVEVMKTHMKLIERL